MKVPELKVNRGARKEHPHGRAFFAAVRTPTWMRVLRATVGAPASGGSTRLQPGVKFNPNPALALVLEE